MGYPRSTGYGSGTPKINEVQQPFPTNRILGTSDFSFPFGQLAYEGTVGDPTGTVVFYAGKGQWLPLGGSTSQVSTLTGNIGGAVGPTAGNIFIEGGPGTGIRFTGTPSLSQLILSLPGGGWTWIPETMNFTPSAGNGYLINSVSQITATLPVSPNQGDTFILADIGGGTFKIAQNTGDSIQFGDLTSTTSTGGVQSSKKGDVLMFVCFSAGPGASWIGLQPTGVFSVT